VATSPEIDALARLQQNVIHHSYQDGDAVNRTNCGFPPDVCAVLCSSYPVASVDMLCKKQDRDDL
jgi:hypothetical protein